MKVRNLFFAVLASAAVLVGCEKKEDLGGAKLELNPTSLEFGKDAGSKDVTLTATRDWKAQNIPAGFVVEPSEGAGSTKPQTVKVSVKENKEYDINGEIVFTIGTISKTLKVSQKGEKGEQQIETITIQEFITKADAENEYTVHGTVSNFTYTDKKKSFIINDGTGALTIFFPKNIDDYKDKIEDGGVAYVKGTYSKFNQEHQIKNGTILEFKSASDLPFEGNKTVKEALEAGAGHKVAVEALVLAAHAQGMVIGDNTGVMMVFLGNAEGVTIPAVGTKIEITGVLANQYGFIQFGKGSTYTEKGQEAVTYPEPEKVTAVNVAEIPKGTAVKFIEVDGTMQVVKGSSYNTYNIVIDGSETIVGKLAYTLAEKDAELTALDGRRLKVKGYYVGTNKDKTNFSIMYTEIVADNSPYLNVEKAEVAVSSTDTEANIAVTSNTSWTATASAGATLDNANGENNGTIKVTFAANEDTENAKTYTVTLKANDCEDVVVTITQAKKLAEGVVRKYVKVTADQTDWSGKYLIVDEVAKIAFDGSLTALDAEANHKSVVISANEIAWSDDVNAMSFTIAAMTGGYSIQSSNSSQQYIGSTSTGKNELKASSDPILNTISFENNEVTIVGKESVLVYNSNNSSGNNRFRYYKPATITQSAYRKVSLYKYTEE